MRTRDHSLSIPSWQGLALPSTSFVEQVEVFSSKLVDPKAKPWDDGWVEG
jgi:hypothetical protein